MTAIYVAVRKPEMERVEAQIAEYGFTGRVHVVEGGDSRQESVAHALPRCRRSRRRCAGARCGAAAD